MTDLPAEIRAKTAVTILERHLAAIPHPTGMLRLVQFDHDSAGLRKLRKYLAEGLVMLLESNGMHIHNGLDESVAALRGAGYTVTPPSQELQPETAHVSSNAHV